MAKRHDLRQRYMEGWYEMDIEKLQSSVAPGFVFDDPVEPEPVTRDMLAGYMERWDRRTRAAGSTNEWLLTDHVRKDKDGVLTDWSEWALVGTALRGMELVKTTDEGVLLERITYFDRETGE